MNDNRFSRQAYKNLLGGLGATLIGHTNSTATTNGDENLNLMMNAKNLKSTGSLLGLNSGVQSINTTSSTTSISASLHTASSAAASCLNGNTLITSQSYSTQINTLNNASIRNALGDIGNKIGLTHNMQLGAIGKKENILIKPTVEFKNDKLSQEKLNEESKIEVLKPAENNNNSCVMLEEDDDDEVEEIDLDEEQEANKSEIIDIDEPDAENTQLASEYVKDIYKYLNQMEKRFRISPNFLDKKIVTSKMRSVLIDWLIQVHLKFHLLQETLYLCVQIIDAYLQVTDVPKMQLQLVGVTAMFLASKYEEMYVPAIDDFVYMTDNTYTKSEIRQMEISILKTLNFMFGKPLPLHFLRRFSKAGQADPKQHTLAKYFMELSLHDAEFSSMDPSYLAACSLNLSFKLSNGPEWNRTLEHYSTYKQNSLGPGMQRIAKLTLKSTDADYKYRAATNKYGASKFMRISLLPELNSSYMRELAAGRAEC